jgi:uncharacterized membrane protein
MNWKTFGINLADSVASFVGSWKFIIWQSVILIIWMFINVEQVVHFDPYPFILMNLLLSSQAAYATPMILMSSNRQAIKDREQTAIDLKLDEETNQIIKDLKRNFDDHIISQKQHKILIEKIDKLEELIKGKL